MAANSSYFARSMTAASLIATRFKVARKVPWIAMVIEKVMLQETIEMNLEELISDEKPTLTPWEVTRCIIWYHYNVNIDVQYEAATGRSWPDLAPSYRDEKIADYRQGLSHWWGRFDYGNQTRWIAAAVAKYEADARTSTRCNEDAMRVFVENDQ